MISLKIKFFFVLVLISNFFTSCNFVEKNISQTTNKNLSFPGSEKNGLSILTWNTQTFFDTTITGSEYNGYNKINSTWNETTYHNRIKKLCNVLDVNNADIIVLQEIENQEIILDIVNNLRNQGIKSKAYHYSFFYKNPEDVFGNGILSKYPLGYPKIHELYTDLTIKQPNLRPITEITVFPKGIQPEILSELEYTELANKNLLLNIFLCHWKSKSSGEESSKIWRKFQEKICAQIAQKAITENYIFCGDFNKELYEFSHSIEDNEVIFQNSQNSIHLISPWFSSEEKGSYFYKNSWERIDHFFLSKKLSFQDFKVIKEFTTKNDGTPNRFILYTGEGYSDHLPLFIKVTKDF